MNKSKFSINQIGKYLREISVVVIGVAITLSVTVWISHKNEKKDMALYLNAIKLELKENMKELDQAIEEMKPSYRYSIYLQTHDKKSLNQDTLRRYIPVCYSFYTCTFKTNAFEMFKSSGIMRLMDNKELLMELWGVYADLSTLKQSYDEYYRRKWNYMEKDFALQGIDYEKEQMILNVVPMYDFYRIGFSFLSETEEMLEALKEVVSKLEEESKK